MPLGNPFKALLPPGLKEPPQKVPQSANEAEDFSYLPGPLRGTAEVAHILQTTVENDTIVMHDVNDKIGLTGLFDTIIKYLAIFLIVVVVFLIILGKIF